MTPREQARVIGRTYYDPGAPCANGHNSERYIATGKCVECNRVKRKRWCDRHPEKATAHLRRHLERLGDRRNGPPV
jgi:hypothetical protein